MNEPKGVVDAEFAEEDGAPPHSPFYEPVMNPYDFCLWLQGFLEASGKELDAEKTAMISKKLGPILSRPVGVPIVQGFPGYGPMPGPGGPGFPYPPYPPYQPPPRR